MPVKTWKTASDSIADAATRVFTNLLGTADSQPGWQVNGDGKTWWGPGGTTPADTNLYRSAAGILKTDSLLYVAGNPAGGPSIWAWGGIQVGANSVGVNPAFGLIFGSGQDTNLYRSAADTLRTDDNLVVGGNLTVTGSYPTSTPPDATTTSKGVVQLAGDLAGTATAPTVKRPAVTYGTIPPASPADGDLWIYPADTTQGVMWQFRYRAASASANKWEFIGGPPLIARIAAQESTTSVGSYVNVATVGPSITIPRTGDYSATYAAGLTDTAQQSYCGPALGIGDFAGPIQPTGLSPLGAGGWIGVGETIWGPSALTAGQELRMKYYQQLAGTLNVNNRAIFLTPLRVQ